MNSKMVPQTQSLTSVLQSIHPSKLALRLSNPIIYNFTPRFNSRTLKSWCRRSPFVRPLRCSVSVTPEPTHLQSTSNNNSNKPFPAEVSRTIMELSSVGTFSTVTPEAWPLGIGVRFAVDPDGTPVVCLNASYQQFASGKSSSLHVQLDQCGLRTPQCTIQGSLDRPDDQMALKKIQSLWERRFGEEVDSKFIHVLSVERVLQIHDFMEDGVWVTSSDYRLASPDPLRHFAEQIVDEINTHNMEDVLRFCNIYVDSDVQVSDAKMVWVDRLGFDMRLHSLEKDVFEVRIPFPREVTDEKGAKSSFNCMSQVAWEVERNYHVPEFKKVKQLKKIAWKGK